MGSMSCRQRLESLLVAGLVGALLVVGVIGCAPTASAGQPDAGSQPGKAITVAAAANLQNAFQEIAPLFEQETGARVTLTFGASGNLATQIENGAPVDVFASADEQFVTKLADQGAVIPDSVEPYAIGRLVLTANKASGVSLTDLDDLLKPEVKKVAIANPDIAPYGRIAKQALGAAGVWDALVPKLVYGQNINQALQFVQTGNAEGGLIAHSLAVVPEVSCVPIDDSLYQPLQQTMAVVKGTKQEALAREFIAFVTGPEGQAVLQRHNFDTPGQR